MSNQLPLANPHQPHPLQIGRQVRYVLASGRICTAIVSEVLDHVNGLISCHVFLDPKRDPPIDAKDPLVSTTPIARNVPYDAQNERPGTWHWPNKTPPEIVPVGGNAPQKIIPPQGGSGPKEAARVHPDAVDDSIHTSGYIETMPDADCILSLQSESQDRFVRGAMPQVFAWMPIEDKTFPGIGWLDMAVQTVALWRSTGRKVLIHCSDGQSRAGLVDVAYHMRLNGWNRDQALSMVRTKRTSTNPNPYFLQGLAEYGQFLNTQIGPPKMDQREIGPAVPANQYPQVRR